MTTKQQATSNWRSPEVEAKFRLADEARWASVTENLPDAIDVPTSFGSTRVYHWPGTGPDIVFLHGMADTSFRWVAYAEALADYNVYAVDTMGEPGRSVPSVAFESADEYGVWLTETIEGLGLHAPHLVGHSMGGYLALSSVVQGGPAGSVVLFDPVGVAELKLVRFLVWNAMVAIGAYSPGPIRRWFARRLRHPVIDDKLDFGALAKSQRGHPAKPMPLPVFTDAQLASIAQPVRVVAGAESSAFDVDEMVQRVAEFLEAGTARKLADAGHALVMSHFDECLAEIRSATSAVGESSD